jgi:hypothetical protein
MNKFLKSAFAVAVTAVAVAAQANTVDIATTVKFPSSFGVATFIDGKQYNVDAVEYDFTTTTGNTFAAFCIDIPTDIAIGGKGPTYVGPGLYDAAMKAMPSISALFKVAGFNGQDYKHDGVTTAKQAASLQLAIWDVIYDGGTLNANAFTTGSFKAGSSAAAGAQALITAASKLKGFEFSSQVIQLTSIPGGRSQTLVTTIPEPSTYALMAACLGVMGLVSRRKQA